MTAEIWNTYEMALAATTGGLIVGVPVIALMVLKRWDGSRELAAAKGWWAKAIAVQEANDKARWAPAYSGNLFAIEADKPHEGEVLHVEHATAELRQLITQLEATDDDALPVSDRSHADEQADHTDTDRPRWWATVVAFVVLAPVAFARRQLPVLAEWARERFKTDAARTSELLAAAGDRPTRDEVIVDTVRGLRSTGHSDEDVVAELKDLFGLGLEPWTLYDEDELRADGMDEVEILLMREGIVLVPTEPAAELEVPAEVPTRVDGIREVLAASGYELDAPAHPFVVGAIVGVCDTCDTHIDEGFHAAHEDELAEQRAEWVALNPPANLGPDGQRHWNDMTAMHSIVTPGRHAIPAQRTGELCGHAYIGNVGEFTCNRYAHTDGDHWNSLAEFGWTDTTNEERAA